MAWKERTDANDFGKWPRCCRRLTKHKLIALHKGLNSTMASVTRVWPKAPQLAEATATATVEGGEMARARTTYG